MDEEHNERPGWVRLPAPDDEGGSVPGSGWVRLPAHDDEGDSAPGSGRARASSVRRVRRASNWTAAALIAGLAAAVGYFAHHTQPAVPATSTATTGAPGGASTASPGKPALTSPVVTSTGSAASGEDGQRDN